MMIVILVMIIVLCVINIPAVIFLVILIKELWINEKNNNAKKRLPK